MITKKYSSLSIFILFFIISLFFITPSIHASLCIVNEYPAEITSINPGIYLAQGPDYYNAHTHGRISVTQSGNPPNIVNGTIIYINHTLKTSSAVLEINNTYNFTVHLWINGSLPSIVTLYNATPAAFSSLGYLNNPYTLGTEINLTSGSPDMYFGFDLKKSTTAESIIYFDYELGAGIYVIYTFQIYVNK